MCDEWMPVVELSIALEQFHQLPRHPAFHYQYLNRRAYLTPRPKFYHALLDFAKFRPPEPVARDVALRTVDGGDWPSLERLFASAFRSQQPYASLDELTRADAARQSLEKVRGGGDGPWIKQASFVAVDKDRTLVGAVFITLLPDEDASGWDSFRWAEPPPSDCVARGLGRPHLTWIFVNPLDAGRGTGTLLLSAAVRALGDLGYSHMASTFLLGNESSMLWHWRSGFQLQAYPTSKRLLRWHN